MPRSTFNNIYFTFLEIAVESEKYELHQFPDKMLHIPDNVYHIPDKTKNVSFTSNFIADKVIWLETRVANIEDQVTDATHNDSRSENQINCRLCLFYFREYFLLKK